MFPQGKYFSSEKIEAGMFPWVVGILPTSLSVLRKACVLDYDVSERGEKGSSLVRMFVHVPSK